MPVYSSHTYLLQVHFAASTGDVFLSVRVTRLCAVRASIRFASPGFGTAKALIHVICTTLICACDVYIRVVRGLRCDLLRSIDECVTTR